MHAAVLHALEKLPLFEEFPDPTPGEGEVLIHVCAAALKPVDKQLAGGKHYASPREFPVVCGAGGVGRLEDGTRMFFGGPRRPYGAMACVKDDDACGRLRLLHCVDHFVEMECRILNGKFIRALCVDAGQEVDAINLKRVSGKKEKAYVAGR